jgi:zinc D-Ala-D-Ala carboxypeptidase
VLSAVLVACAGAPHPGSAQTGAAPGAPVAAITVGSAATGPAADGGAGLAVGAAATDTFGGYLPDGHMLTAFDVANPIVGRLQPELLTAIQAATRAAAAEGVDMKITSGWRSPGFQERLFADGVRTYGSADAASQFVASPEASHHVSGHAVDVGPQEASEWLVRNSLRFGLCQVYANEIWHYELLPEGRRSCPPLLANAAG